MARKYQNEQMEHFQMTMILERYVTRCFLLHYCLFLLSSNCWRTISCLSYPERFNTRRLAISLKTFVIQWILTPTMNIPKHADGLDRWQLCLQRRRIIDLGVATVT